MDNSERSSCVTRPSMPSSGADAAPSQQPIAFHGNFWMRLVSGRYLIADQDIQAVPTSYLPQILLVAVGLVWVALARLLFARLQARPVVQAVGRQPDAVDATGARRSMCHSRVYLARYR